MTTKSQSSENHPKGDDRNIVSLDSSYEGASFEDRVFLFWNKYQNIIVGICIVAVLALIGWALIEFMQGRREAGIAAEYQEAVSTAEITAFAERNAPHPLAGAAFLEVADYHFENNDFSEAAQYYGKAGEILPPVVAGRAKIGQGISLAQLDDKAAALAHMERIAADTSLFRATRAEAYYYAATLAIELGQFDDARDFIGRIPELDDSQMWVSRSRSLEQALPETAPEEVAAETDAANEAPSN